MTPGSRIGIVGGGIMGVTLGYLLSAAGATVEIFEASGVLGGLAGPLVLPDGVEVDRFYHAILPTDEHLRTLCHEVGLDDRLRFADIRTGVFIGGATHSMSTPVDLLRFPPLAPVDRFRLAWTVMAAQRVRDWRELENEPIEAWLRRHGGHRVFETLWQPMLAAKFDGRWDDVRATWIWSRFARTETTRRGVAQRQEAGHIVGGYKALLDALARRIEAAGGRIHLNMPVREVVIENGRVTGIDRGDSVTPCDGVALTMQAPVAARLVPGAPAAYRAALQRQAYLGVVCPLVALDRPLTGNWVLNIADTGVGLTGVIETTTYIDPRLVGGHHLVYLPKYVRPGSPWLTASDDSIVDTWTSWLEALVPRFDPRWVTHVVVHRERYVEPLHAVGMRDGVPDLQSPVRGLFLATTAQIYPALTNGESVTHLARRATDAIVGALSEAAA